MCIRDRSKFVEPERTPVLYLGDDDDVSSDDGALPPATPASRRRPAPPPASASRRRPAPPASAPRTEFIDVPPPPPVPRGFGPPAQAFPTPPGSAPVYQRRSPRRLFI